MRIRSIKPEFWTDEKVGSWDSDTRLAFIWCWSEADDEGLLRLTPASLRAGAFMFRDMSLADARRIIAALVNSGRVEQYAVSGETYGRIANFRKHQVINKPSKSRIPSPDDPGATTGTLPEDSRSTTVVLPEHYAMELGARNREQGNDRGAKSAEEGGVRGGDQPVAALPETAPEPIKKKTRQEPVTQDVYTAAIDAYVEHCCPSLSANVVLDEPLKDAIAKRWRTLKAQCNGSTPPPEKVFAEFFLRVASSDFLMGRKVGNDGRTWKANFRWLMTRGWTGVIEGKYDSTSAAISTLASLKAQGWFDHD